jgi:hypothetical protein
MIHDAVHCAVVNGLFGSQSCYEFKVSHGRGSCYTRAAKSGELDREDAHRTGSAMHQHMLSRVESCPIEQPLSRSQRANRN